MQPWSVITSWLAEHSPGEYALIRPPAAEEQLAAVERAVDRPLPAQLAAWWRQADGIDGDVGLIPWGLTPFSVERALHGRASVLKHWNGRQRNSDPERFDAYVTDAEARPAGSEAHVWMPSFLPIAGRNANWIFADLRPGPMHGCLKEFDNEEGISRDLVWNNVAHLLVEIGVAMRHGSRVRGHRISVGDDGVVSSARLAASGLYGVIDRIRIRTADPGRGLGRAGMTALGNRALEDGLTTDLLSATADGQRLYSALGWVIRGELAGAFRS